MPTTPHNLAGLAPNYIERKAILSNLNAEIVKNKRVILSGLQGSGKTQLALHYANSFVNQQKYDAVVNVSCKNSQTDSTAEINRLINNATQNFVAEKTDEKGEDKAVDINNIIKSSTKNVLYIFDDVDNISQLLKFLPPHVTMKDTIIVSRKISQEYINNTIKVGSFDNNEAIDFAKQHLSKKSLPLENEHDKLKCLADLCFNYPLRLKEVIDMINESANLDEYFIGYKKYFVEKNMEVDLDRHFTFIDKSDVRPILNPLFSYSGQNTRDAMLTPYRIILKQINAHDKNILDQLLTYLSILYSKRIPKLLIKKLFPDQESQIVERFIKKLEEFHVISKDQSSGLSYSISPLFQYIWRNKLLREQVKESANNAMFCFTPLFKNANKVDEMMKYAYALHAETLAYHAERVEARPLDLAEINLLLGEFYDTDSSVKKPLEYYDRSRKYYETENLLSERFAQLDINSRFNNAEKCDVISKMSEEERKHLLNYCNVLKKVAFIRLNNWSSISEEEKLAIGKMLGKSAYLLDLIKEWVRITPVVLSDEIQNAIKCHRREVIMGLARMHRKFKNYEAAREQYLVLGIYDFEGHLERAYINLLSPPPKQSRFDRIEHYEKDTLNFLDSLKSPESKKWYHKMYARCCKRIIDEEVESKFGGDRKAISALKKSIMALTHSKASEEEESLISEDKYAKRALKYSKILLTHCKNYFAALKIGEYDPATFQSTSQAELSSSKLFYISAITCMKAYEKRKEVLKEKVLNKYPNENQNEINKHLEEVMINDKFLSEILGVALEICNLGITTQRSLYLPPNHPYVENIRKLYSNIFSQLGYKNVSNYLVWSASNNYIDKKLDILYQQRADEVRQLDSKDDQALNIRDYLGDLAMNRARYNDAITNFQIYLENKTDSLAVGKKLGYAYFGAKRYTDAIAEFKKVLLLQPTDHKTFLWFKAARFEEERAKIATTHAPTGAYTHFIEGFENEFVRKIKEYNNKLEGRDLRDSEDVIALKLFGSFAKLLPDLNIGVAPSPVSATIHLADPVASAIQTKVDQLVSIEKTRANYLKDLNNNLINNEELKLKAFAKVVANHDELLKAIIHRIACDLADSYPNIINMFTEKSVGDAGMGIAQRIIQYFADHKNNETLNLEEQINLAVYKGQCDTDIELYKKNGWFPYSLNSVITKSAMLTSTGHLYYREKPKLVFTKSFAFLGNLAEQLPFFQYDRHRRYGIHIGQPIHQLDTEYKEKDIKSIVHETFLTNLKRH